MTVSIPSSTLEKFTTFGDLLRFLRRRMGITQTELAIAVGYSHTQISRLEQNLRLPDIPTIEARFVSALGLEQEPKAVTRLLDLAANVRREDAPTLGLCPYKGLNYFDEADADLFVGREALTAKLVERVLSLTLRQAQGKPLSESPYETRFLAVIGASGGGKSSLVRAGLIPALRWNKASADWHIHILTPTTHPLESLAGTVVQESNSVTAIANLMDDLASDPRSLQIFAKRKLNLENNIRLLLVVDQFEELFALCRSEEQRVSFISNLLAAASETDGPISIVITLRADFYAYCANYPHLREALAHNQEYIGAMNEEELRRAIEEPAQRGRWEFESGLVDLLLHEVGHEPGALPLLSHALLETWQRRRGRTMTLSGYASSGGVRGAIAETAETVFTDQFTREQQAIARRILLRLTEISDENSLADTRRRASFNELILKPEEETITHVVLKALADARLITTSQDSAEVAHEALIREWPTLRGWLEENREGLRLHRQLTEAAQEWLEADRSQESLYRGARLSQARDWASTHQEEMNDLEREFIAVSVRFSQEEAAEREAQRLRELEAAQKLAQTEKARADENIQSAQSLRIRNHMITTVGAIALGLAVLAGLFGIQSNNNLNAAQIANTQSAANAASAQVEAQARSTQQAIAEANFRQAEAQRLAAEASKLLLSQGSPEQIALLSLRSMNIQYTPQGDAALAAAATLKYPKQVFSIYPYYPIRGVAFSPDAKHIVTGSGYGVYPTIWEARTGEQIRRFFGDAIGVLGIAYSLDGKYVLTGGWDQTARMWDPVTGKLVRHFIGHTDTVWSVAFSPDGNQVLTGSFDRTARIWDVATAKEIRQFIGHAAVRSVTFSPDGEYALLGRVDGAMELWNVQTGAEMRQFMGNTSSVNSVAFSPDGEVILAGGNDLMARLWDASTGKVLQSFIGHTRSIQSVAFSPDGQYVFTGSDDGTARKWDPQSGQELARFIGTASVGNTASMPIAISQDGKSLVTSSSEGVTRLWNINDTPKLPIFKHSGIVNGLAFSTDGKYVFIGDSSGMLRMWDAVTGEKLRDFVGHTDVINYGVAFSPNGKYILTGSWDQTVRLWDIETGKELRKFLGPTTGVDSVAFSPDGKYVSAGAPDGMWLWFTETGQEVHQLIKFRYLGVSRVAFSPDGKLIATVEDDKAKVWDISTKQLIFFRYGFIAQNSVAFSPDGKQILTTSDDNTARLWDIHPKNEILQFTGHTASILSAVFSPDGKYIATASEDSTARLWDARTGQELRRFIGHAAAVGNVIFSPDGKYLLTGSDDGTARLWDVDYHTTIDYLCSVLLRDFTDEERTKYNITDHTPTCPKK